jgi:aminopeptidase N
VTAIFYPEDALAQGRDIELTVAHETAHQWFGDAVTEADWRHLWLSEGFATYFSALFYEKADGDEKFREVMQDFRQQYLISSVTDRPIVDQSEDNLFELLNANNYDKGAWVLHMLRRLLGDEVFFDGIRDYYRRFEHGTALTEDFRRALERASGRDLEGFFDRWVFSPGHPRFAVTWSVQEETRVVFEQVQPEDWPTYAGPLTLEYSTSDGLIRKVVEIDSREEVAVLPERASNLSVDPDDDVLREIVSIQQLDPR